jgi:hypothetical protein
MWKIFEKNKNNNSSSTSLRERLNSDMDYLGLDEDIQKGFLFFLGASLNIGFKDTGLDLSKFNTDESEYLKNLEKTIDSYSRSTGEFSDYGQLNDHVFTSYIYSINFIFHNILANGNIDDELRNLRLSEDSEPIVFGKTKLIKDFVEPYENSADANFKLNDYHNLIELFFKKIGQHLTEADFDNSKSYEAGYAYFCMQCHFDLNGTFKLLHTIYELLTPLYMALYNYPILHQFYLKEFDSNHIFSNTLQMFYGGINPAVIMPIHHFHQHIFYSSFPWKYSLENTSSNFSWKFNLKDDAGFQSGILQYALKIKESGLVDDIKPIIDSEEVFNKDLINSKIAKNEFYGLMFKVVHEKYHIAPVNQNNRDLMSWNNLGDFIQYCAILFYETSLHAAVVDELTEA